MTAERVTGELVNWSYLRMEESNGYVSRRVLGSQKTPIVLNFDQAKFIHTYDWWCMNFF